MGGGRSVGGMTRGGGGRSVGGMTRGGWRSFSRRYDSRWVEVVQSAV